MSQSAPTDIDIGRFYTPQPVRRKFHASEARYPLLEGGRGGGKSTALLWEAISQYLLVPGVSPGTLPASHLPEYPISQSTEATNAPEDVPPADGMPHNNESCRAPPNRAASCNQSRARQIHSGSSGKSDAFTIPWLVPRQ